MKYFDTAITARPCALAIEAAKEVLHISPHTPDAETVFHGAGGMMEHVFGPHADGSIVFTNGAADNLQLALTISCGITSPPNVLTFAGDSLHILEQRMSVEMIGGKFTTLPVSYDGGIDYAILEEAVYPSITLVCISLVNTETGVINHAAEIAAAVKAQAPALVYVDATHAVGSMDIANIDPSIDIVGVDAKGLRGLPGSGVLWVRRGIDFDIDETENIAGVAALGAVAAKHQDLLKKRLDSAAMGHMTLTRLLTKANGFAENCGAHQRASHIISFNVEDIDADTLYLTLLKEGIRTYTRERPWEDGPSHVMQAMGKNNGSLNNNISFSLHGLDEGDEALEETARTVLECVKSLRKMK
jgi:cysteine desulfurase